jgi:hypothetical protein
MDYAYRFARRVLACGCLTFAATSPAALAQAWVPPGGAGAVTVTSQTIDNTGHRLTDGSMLEGYDSLSRGVQLEVDYAFTDRVSFSASIPYVFAKYLGPEPSFSSLPIDDCHCWNHGWQDFGVTARYNVANGAFALTPSVSFGVPSHNYSYFGEAVLGRNLREMRLAVDAGQRLDAISPRLFVQGRYAYTLVEKVIGISNNRTNAAIQTGLLVTRRVSTRALFSWQRTHGGLRGTEFDTPERFQQFDRLLKDNYFHAGGGISYSLPQFDVFVAYVHYVSGTDTHAGRALTTGISWPFELR